VAVNPVTNKVYVTTLNSNSVTVIDGMTNATTTVAVGAFPYSVAVNPVTNKIYVANSDSNNVTVIDGATNATITLPAGATPYSLAVNPVTNTIYVANYGGSSVTVIDGATNATTTVAAGSGANYVAVNPVTNRIYVANTNSDSLTVIDGATNATTTVAFGASPHSVAVNPATNTIYVANDHSDSVTAIDGATNATTTISAGARPYSVAVNPVTNKIYVVNMDSGNLTVIDGVTNSTTAVAMGSIPASVAVNPVTNTIYVSDYGDDNVIALREQVASQIPLTTTIFPLASAFADSATPTFTLSATSAFAPTAPPVQGVFTQVDTWQGSWQAAVPSAGVFTATTSPLGAGTHVLYAYAVDGQDGTGCSNGDGSPCSPLVGSMAAYVFTVPEPPADISITKTDDASTAVPGTPVTYTIVATNAGPSNAPSVTVADTFPATCTGATWTCTSAGGGTCAATGASDINDRASLPVGGSATYTATCSISPSATGTLANLATATVGGGVTDPNPTNNGAMDTDILTPQPVVIWRPSKTVSGSYTINGSITYTITLTNTGTATQPDNPGHELVDVLPVSLGLVSASATSGTVTPNLPGNSVSWDGSLSSTGAVTITITGTVKPRVALGTTLSNQATVFYDADGDGTNESTVVTDDPTAAGSNDATNFVVVSPSMAFFPLTPCRLVDTRNAAGTFGGPALAAGTTRAFPLFDQCNVPATARAVSVNLTVTSSTTAGNLRLFPAGAAVPTVSSINYVPGLTRANNAVVGLNGLGELAVYCAQASGTVHFILDVNGYFE
jgi:uncharacterized repeat protein (TIGR01451 family)